MSTRYDRWRDAHGTHIPEQCRIEQVEVRKDLGALPSAQANSDPWMEAWRKLRAFIDSGATQQQATEYARELGRGLPDARDPQAHAKQAEAVQQVVRDILG